MVIEIVLEAVVKIEKGFVYIKVGKTLVSIVKAFCVRR